MKRLNRKLVVLLLSLAAVLGAGGFVAYKVQKKLSVAALLVQARAAEKAGDLSRAERLYAHYLGFRPEDSATLADYGELLVRRADSPEARIKALAVLEQLLRRDPDRSEIRREVIRIAMDRTIQRYPEALAQLKVLLAASPDDGEMELLAARCLVGERKYPEAAELYAKASVHKPTETEGYVRHAELLRTRLDHPTEAEKVLDRMVELNPNSYRAFLERGSQRLLDGVEGADRDLARALELAPDEPDVLAAAADLAIRQGDVERARRLAARCLDLRPKDSRSCALLFRIELKEGHKEEAEAILRRGVEVTVDAESRIRLLIDLASLQIGLGKYPEAEQAIERMNAEKARPEYGKFFAAQVLAGKSRWRAACQILEEIHPGLVDTPDMAFEADMLLARCRERLGEHDRRAAAFSRAIGLRSSSLPARLGLAEAYASSGRIDEAIAQYRNLDGEVPQVRVNLAALLIRRNLQRPTDRRDWAEVDRALVDAEATSPGSMEVQLLRAEAFADRGRPEESRGELKAAARKFPQRDEPWTAQAELALKLGQREVAASVLDEAERILGDRVALRLARADLLVAQGGKQAISGLDRLAEGLDRLPEAARPRMLRALAEAHRQIGDLPNARRIMDQIAEQSPDDLDFRLARLDLAYRANDPAGMKEIIDSIGPNDEVIAKLARARYLTWTATQPGRSGPLDRAALDEARRLLGQISVHRPNWLPAVLASAYVEDLDGNREGAVRGYLQGVELGERDLNIVLRTIALLVARARFDQADEVVRKTLSGNGPPGDPRLYRIAADVAIRVKDMPRALDYGSKAIATDTRVPGDRLWRGRLLWAAGQTTRAEADLRAASATAGDTEAPEAWVSLVTFLASLGRQPEAEQAIDQARRRLPEPGRSLALARCFAVLNQPEPAREQYRAALAAAPEDQATLRTASQLALTIGQFEDAKEYLRKLVSRQATAPDDAAQSRRILGVLLAASGDPRQARESLEVMGLVENNLPYRPAADESTEDLRAKAKVLAFRGGRQNRRAAIDALTTILGRENPSPDDRFLLAQVLDRNGDWPKAREQMQLLLAEFGESSPFLTFYIQGLLRHEEARGARAWLEKLEKAAPSSFPTVELKARLASAEGHPEAAAKLLGDFARATPQATLAAAIALESLGRPADAEELFRRFATQDKEPEAGLVLAAFLGRQKRVAEALELCDAAWKSGRPELVSQASVTVLYGSRAGEEACRRVADLMAEAIRRAPEKVSLQFDLANVEILRGRYPQAEAIFRKLYDMDKENPSSANNLAWLMTIQDGKASEALSLIDRAIELSGPLPTLLDTRALARIALGQIDPAVEDLEEATNVGPSATRYFHLAQAYLKANRTRDAREALREANLLGLDERALHPTDRKSYRQLLDELPPG